MTDIKDAPVGEYERSTARQSLVKWLCLNTHQQADSCMYGPNGCSCVERAAQMLANIKAAERERCAKIADAYARSCGSVNGRAAAQDISRRIREHE